MTKTSRARYTLEFKQEAVRLVRAGQSMAAAARALLATMSTLYAAPATRKGATSAITPCWFISKPFTPRCVVSTAGHAFGGRFLQAASG